MRKTHDPQPQLGQVGIEDIELDLRSRDDIPALPVGLQHPCSDEAFRGRLFALMDEHILPGVSRKTGRPGMEMWRILVMGVASRASAATSTGCTGWRRAQDAAPVPWPRGHPGRAPLQVPDAGGQREPHGSRASRRGQQAGCGERPCGRGKKSLARPCAGAPSPSPCSP